MSLYDKASLIFSGAAGAGNEEVAYNIKPVEKLKVDELIKNNGFDTDSDWFKSTGVTISGGKANFPYTSSGYKRISQDNIFEAGKTYKVSFELDIEAGSVKVGTASDSDSMGIFKTSGKHSVYYTGIEGEDRFDIARNNEPYEFTVDNVSVREVEQKANDFSFVRASDLTATYEGPDGLIKKTRENLLLQSNQFDTTWTLNSASLTGGKGGYDGSSNAWELKATGNGSTHLARLNQTSLSVSGVSTFSVYAKAGNVNWIRLNALTNGTNVNNYFDLSGNGAVGASPSNTVVESKIESIGGNWFRVSLTSKGEASIYEVRIQVAEADGDEIPATNSYIFIQNSQLEPGQVVTPYIDRTDSYSNSTAGIQEDEPRYDYSLDNALPPALLYEPERQNLLPHSEYFTFAGRTTITQNHDTSPEGVENSTRFTNTTETGAHRTYSNGTFNATSGDTYTVSVFAKKGSLKKLSFKIMASNESDIGFAEPIFNLEDGSIGGDSSNASMVNYGNGWYRCISTSSPTSTPSNARVYFYFRKDDDTKSYTGTTSENIEIYGAQVEEGSCVTSYIPTYGSAGTRKADVIPQYTPYKTNLDKYTFFAHYHSDRVASDNRAPRLKGDGNSALMGIFVNNDGKKQFFFDDNESNRPLSKATFGSFEAGDDTKYAFVVDNIALEAKLFIDGALRETISLTERADAKIISVGTSDGNPDRIKSIMYFPEALENSDVVSLTT